MGFWNLVKDIAKDAFEQIKETSAKTNELRDSYSNKNDDYLVKKFKSGSFTEKTAAARVIKERKGS